MAPSRVRATRAARRCASRFLAASARRSKKRKPRLAECRMSRRNVTARAIDSNRHSFSIP
ncbi:hypothetical protein DIS09_19625 [Burkholderia pseudomallei]|uniref:Uncharacterized protein n=1 Tax=Burkholderia pseudomallei TaxID=28450 RepID=A0AAX0UDW3_BURPE|nr:hypothetical protein EGY14_19130 [Burkholderia pseudomallei]PJO66518.1 hypothetical protein CWD88_09850 [Burkholderia pseudomallei]TPA01823.1 hypothetical protein DIJ61_29810 [Burkholderia pseudomallei]TPE96957.1 hypothetical protein DIS09_19625 [Burkholderia pseudomallei]